MKTIESVKNGTLSNVKATEKRRPKGSSLSTVHLTNNDKLVQEYSASYRKWGEANLEALYLKEAPKQPVSVSTLGCLLELEPNNQKKPEQNG